MKNPVKLSVLFLLVICFAFGIGSALAASKYPEKPITVIIHAGAGAAATSSRAQMAAAIEKERILPQPLVVENKPGGSGGIAFAYVAGKKKDPYFPRHRGHQFPDDAADGPHPGRPQGLHPRGPTSPLTSTMLMSNAKSKFKTAKEAIDFAKANPKRSPSAVPARLLRLPSVPT